MPHEVGGSAETRRLLTMTSALAASVLCPRSRCFILRVFPALLTSWPWVSVVKMGATGRNSQMRGTLGTRSASVSPQGVEGAHEKKKKKSGTFSSGSCCVFPPWPARSRTSLCFLLKVYVNSTGHYQRGPNSLIRLFFLSPGLPDHFQFSLVYS